jgi:hypothetical protein
VFVQVYKERIHKRLPGAASRLDETLSEFDSTLSWAANAEILGGSEDGTFTHVLVSGLKPDIVRQFQGDAAENVCNQLAHLYHYYLHGPDGNIFKGVPLLEPLGEKFPICRNTM